MYFDIFITIYIYIHDINTILVLIWELRESRVDLLHTVSGSAKQINS